MGSANVEPKYKHTKLHHEGRWGKPTNREQREHEMLLKKMRMMLSVTDTMSLYNIGHTGHTE